MANWTPNANADMAYIQGATTSTAAQMANLRATIDNWANVNPNGRQGFPFGRFRNHGVSAVTANASVVRVEYGDRF